jgi:hypothetical protein
MSAAGGTVAATGGNSGLGTGGIAAPPSDPTAFVWPESNPDGGSVNLCKAGHYVGTYSCVVGGFPGLPVPTADGGGGYQLTGPVDLILEESQEGEFLVVSGGTLKSAAGLLAMDAKVTGKLNCQTGTFDGSLGEGTVSIPPFPPGGSFTGTMAGAFDSTGPKMTGNWHLIGGPEFANATCTGPWTATWQAQ